MFTKKNLAVVYLLLNWNQLLEGKAYRSVNQHSYPQSMADESLTACILPSSSSWFGLGTSFKMLKISSLLALFLMAIVKQSATVYPGRDPEQKQSGQKHGKASKWALLTSVCLTEKQVPFPATPKTWSFQYHCPHQYAIKLSNTFSGLHGKFKTWNRIFRPKLRQSLSSLKLYFSFHQVSKNTIFPCFSSLYLWWWHFYA